MDEIIMEFWSADTKQAELPISALDDMTEAQLESFASVQEALGRRVLLRYVEEPCLQS